MPPIDHYVHWDSAKAVANFRKHRVLFEEAAKVFDDPLAATRHDVDHGLGDERWVTLGEVDGALLQVVHTLDDLDGQRVRIRIISARHPTPDERWQYESGNYRIQEAVMINKSHPDQWIRGRFYQEGAVFNLPVHVSDDLCVALNRLAKQKGVTPSELANALLKDAISELGSSAGAAAPDATQ